MPRITRRADENIEDSVRTTSFTAVPEKIYRLDLSSGNLQMHLPTASGIGGSDIGIYVEYTGSNQAHIIPSGSETIHGTSGVCLTGRQTLTLTANGLDDWMAFGVPSGVYI